METIQVNASKNYDILIGKDILKNTGNYVSQVIKPCKICIITDDTVYDLYANLVEQSLLKAGFEIYHFIFEHGEKSKNINTVSSILELMAENNFTRSDAIVALGGGITGDIAGFTASVFLRGVQFIQIPTTFLAAVDSSVGGKTGVNLESGKNLAGAFWQPSLVICDIDTFKTLTYEIFLDGIAEAIKYGVILDKSLFDLLSHQGKDLYFSIKNEPNNTANNSPINNNIETLIQIIKQCVSIKRDIVIEDERDTGIRQLLNFGHTIGHSIEKCSNYEITHGHAVAMGMLIVSKASDKLLLTKNNCYLEIKNILEMFNFPLNCPYTANELTQVALKDKKRSGTSITLVLPDQIGICYLEKMDVSKLETFIESGL